MKDLLTWLKGKKTYLIAAAAIVYVFGGDQGWWVVNDSLLVIMGFGSVVTLRHGIRKDTAQPLPPAGETGAGPGMAGPIVSVLMIAAGLGLAAWLCTGCAMTTIKAGDGKRVSVYQVPWPWQDPSAAIKRLYISEKTNSFSASLSGLIQETRTTTNLVELVEAFGRGLAQGLK